MISFNFLFFLSFLFNPSLTFVLVVNFKSLIKDFPIHELLSATNIEAVSQAVTHIFTHLKKTKNNHYPIQRYLGLVEAVARDMCTKVLSVSWNLWIYNYYVLFVFKVFLIGGKILRQHQLMHLDYEEFLKITSACLMLFTVWEDQFEQFREILRELAKKRGQEKIPLRVYFYFVLFSYYFAVVNYFLSIRLT